MFSNSLEKWYLCSVENSTFWSLHSVLVSDSQRRQLTHGVTDSSCDGTASLFYKNLQNEPVCKSCLSNRVHGEYTLRLVGYMI